MDVLASWENRLRIRRTGSGDGTAFMVEGLDEDGSVNASETYPRPELFAAIADYNARWLATLAPGAARAASIVLEISYAMGDRDIDSLRSVLDEEFVFVDHRGIGYPELSRSGLIEATVANADTRSRWLLTTPHVADPSGSVLTGGFWAQNFGEWHNFEIGIWVSFVQADKAIRVELFPDDQLDAAVDRFADLNRSTPRSP